MKKISSVTRHQEALPTRIGKLILRHCLFSGNDTVIVAVSGGPDSVALLHLLHRINRCAGLVAVYVNHGLRPTEIDAEIRLVEGLCGSLGVPCETVPVDVHAERKRTGASLEEAARTLRYAALEAARKQHGASVIAVAHTADDQAEEVLIRLIRGSGGKGLSGMDLRRGPIIRPLLQEKKQTLTDYLEANAIPFCRDSSNQERLFLRNRVRLDLLPYLERNFNTSIRRNLLQTAEILQGEEDLLDQLTEEMLNRLIEKDKTRHLEEGRGNRPCPESIKIKIQAFLNCHPALQRRILEKVCWMMLTRPGFRQIEQVRHLIKDGGNGAETHLGRGLRVWKTGEDIRFSHPAGRTGFRGSGLQDRVFSLSLDGPGHFSIAGHVLSVGMLSTQPEHLLAGELLLDAERISFPLLLRNPLDGEVFRPLGAAGRKKISRFLTDAKIPRQERRFFPVVLSHDRIIAIAGLRIDHDFRVREDTRCFLHLGWQRTPAKTGG